jgi:hypothetical protein
MSPVELPVLPLVEVVPAASAGEDQVESQGSPKPVGMSLPMA